MRLLLNLAVIVTYMGPVVFIGGYKKTGAWMLVIGLICCFLFSSIICYIDDRSC